MALTADEVHDKQFRLVRQSTGYDIDEVDAFLDEVEGTIRALQDDLATAQARAAADPSEAEQPTESPEPPASAAARILELAQRTADDYLADARGAADRMRAEAAGLEHRVAELRSYESDMRVRLREYLSGEVEQLRSVLADTATSAPPTPDATDTADPTS